jgi:hypothetical protein
MRIKADTGVCVGSGQARSAPGRHRLSAGIGVSGRGRHLPGPASGGATADPQIAGVTAQPASGGRQWLAAPQPETTTGQRARTRT